MGPIEGFRGLEGMRYEPVDYRPRLGRGLIERAFASAREELGRRLAPLREAEERRLEGVRRASATRLRAYYHQLQREVLESERRLQRRIDSTREMLAAATTLELRSRRAERLARLEAELASARGSNDLALLRYRREMESQLAREEQRCGLEVEVALTSAAVLEHERRVDTYLLLGRHAHALLERERSHLSEPAPLACSACRAASGELALDARGRLVCPSCARVCGSCGSVRSADDPGPPPSKMLTTPCPACGL
jgi:hypothetical protein